MTLSTLFALWFFSVLGTIAMFLRADSQTLVDNLSVVSSRSRVVSGFERHVMFSRTSEVGRVVVHIVFSGKMRFKMILKVMDEFLTFTAIFLVAFGIFASFITSVFIAQISNVTFSAHSALFFKGVFRTVAMFFRAVGHALSINVS